MHPVEVEQRKIWREVPDDANVIEGVAAMLGVPADEELAELVARALVDADRHVDRYVPLLRSVRRSAIGCGFVAGVLYAEAQRRVREKMAEFEREAAQVELPMPEPMPACPTCGLSAIEARVDSHFEQTTPLGRIRAVPSSAGALYGCPNGHWFRP